MRNTPNLGNCFIKNFLNFFLQIGITTYKLYEPMQHTPIQIQQIFFDKFAEDPSLEYSQFHDQSFWLAADALYLHPVLDSVMPNNTIMDLGCANGRSSKMLWNKQVNIIGVEVSYNLINEYKTTFYNGKQVAHINLLLADGDNLPFAKNSLDTIIVYGVFHHLPNPEKTIQQLITLLKPNGIIYSVENNKTIFRKLFDLFMKIKTLWKEEAGSNPCIGKKDFVAWTKPFENNIVLSIKTAVFLPPHFISVFGKKTAQKILKVTDFIIGKIPFLKNQGGLIVLTLRKKQEKMRKDV
jgi:SAM-dependent methyltransferase